MAVTKIYSLLHGYQTLVREIVTPNLKPFVDACLQLIKPPASGQPLGLPSTVVETVVNALATLVPLYPTTLRPFSAQFRSTTRAYIAPTSSDDSLVSQSLRHASRRLLISLHYSAPKDKHSSDWVKAMDGFIRDCHTTADQVFRAVQESWESSAGYTSGTISYDGEPNGGGSEAAEFPAWSGVQAGAERLVGLLELVSDCFSSPTKSPVAVPLGSLMDLVSRIALITQPTAGREDRFQTNAAIGREEKDELWSALPAIHVAALELLLSMVNRLGQSLVPLSRDMLDHMVRIFKTISHVPSARKVVYTLATDLLSLGGPTLDKLAVDSLTTLIQACCRDLLESAGYIQDSPKPLEPTPTPGSKKPQAVGNADAFLNPKAGENTTSSVHYDASHLQSASALLTSLLTHLPQNHLSPDSRGLIDRTAILSRNKTAMLASVLHPYQDSNGRYYASILPFLMRAFPRDQEVEVLRANLRAPKGGSASASNEMWAEPSNGLDVLLKDSTKDEEPVQAFGGWGEKKDEDMEEEPQASIAPFVPGAMEIDAVEVRPFMSGALSTVTTTVEETVVTVSSEQTPMSPLKRKGESLESGIAKRLEPQPTAEDQGGDESDSDAGSIQIDMTMDDDEDVEDEN